MKKISKFNKKADWNEYEQNVSEWSGPGNKMEAFETSS